MINVEVVGCTGKLGKVMLKTILSHDKIKLSYAIGRKGNEFIGSDISIVTGCQEKTIKTIDDISKAVNCDIFIDCTNSDSLINYNLPQYLKIKKGQ
jgi:4-hydroxy-tetrahydrodipicolinate reductase